MPDKVKARLQDADLPREGDRIDDRYVIKNIIGRGGMSCIVCARQLTIERDVAIKLLHPHVASDELTIARFEREVHLAKGLVHPNIIQYYDYGTLPSGSMYLVMELLEGCDLHTLIRREGNLSMHRSIEIVTQVLDGLSEAHGKSVIHRDLKPRNLFMLDLSRRGDYVKILDFGIAKSTQSGESDLTKTGVVCGTPSYLAPELLITQDAGPPSDLYSVGLIFLEMLTGRRVFKGDTMARTFFMQLRQPVPIPLRFIDTPMEDFLLRALAKHPDDRFQSAHEMIDALEQLRTQMPEDIHLDPDDVDSLSRSRAAVAPGMAMSDGRGLDILRDEAWIVTSAPPVHQLDPDDDMPTTLAELRDGPPLAPSGQLLERHASADSGQITNPLHASLPARRRPAGTPQSGLPAQPASAYSASGRAINGSHPGSPPDAPGSARIPRTNDPFASTPPAFLPGSHAANSGSANPDAADLKDSDENAAEVENTANPWITRGWMALGVVALLGAVGLTLLSHFGEEDGDAAIAMPYDVPAGARAQEQAKDSNFAFIERLGESTREETDQEKPGDLSDDQAAQKDDPSHPGEERTLSSNANDRLADHAKKHDDKERDKDIDTRDEPALVNTENRGEERPKEQPSSKTNSKNDAKKDTKKAAAPKKRRPAPRPAAKPKPPAPRPAAQPDSSPASSPSSVDEFMQDNAILGD